MTQNGKGDKVRQQIDENLRRVFQEDASEELPDRFKQLLLKLQESDNSANSGDPG